MKVTCTYNVYGTVHEEALPQLTRGYNYVMLAQLAERLCIYRNISTAS